MPFVLLLLVGLTHFAQVLANGEAVDAVQLFHRFFPPHQAGGEAGDPFRVVEDLLARISRNRGQLSLYAAPAFIWFSTRLFGGIRTALNDLFDVSLRPEPSRNFLVAYLLSKLRDVVMVLATLTLFLANTVLSAGLALLQTLGATRVPELSFFVSTLGRLLGEMLAFSFAVSLFYVTYRFATVRRIPGRSAFVGAVFTAVLFEVAKRLYGWYLANVASIEGVSGDATIGAAVLFVLWIYYTALVFLLGGAVAETWELRRMQQRQRAMLA